MDDEKRIARDILAQLQHAVAAKDLDDLARLFDDDVVVFGTAAANLDRVQTAAYLASVMAQDGTIRWEWEHVVPLVSESEVFAFAAVGTVGLDDAREQPVGERDAFRLTCIAVSRQGRWRLRHFHGSIPEAD